MRRAARGDLEIGGKLRHLVHQFSEAALPPALRQLLDHRAAHFVAARQRVEAGAVPAMKKMDGFKAYYLVFGADDTVIAVSLFTNKAVAEGSTQKLMPWIEENLCPLLASPTEDIEGEVAISVMN
jgi:hypothetical protein